MTDKTKLTVQMDKSVHREFKIWCMRHEVSMSQVLERIAADLSGEQSGGGDERDLAHQWYRRESPNMGWR